MRGLANTSEGLGAGLAPALSIKVRDWDQAGPGPVDKSEGLGAGLAQGLSINVVLSIT